MVFCQGAQRAILDERQGVGGRPRGRRAFRRLPVVPGHKVLLRIVRPDNEPLCDRVPVLVLGVVVY